MARALFGEDAKPQAYRRLGMETEANADLAQMDDHRRVNQVIARLDEEVLIRVARARKREGRGGLANIPVYAWATIGFPLLVGGVADSNAGGLVGAIIGVILGGTIWVFAITLFTHVIDLPEE